MRFALVVLAATFSVMALFWALSAEAGEKPAETEKPAEKPADRASEGEKPPVDAVALFDKAIAWQGRPADRIGKLLDLHIRQMDFKIWGQNEIEGSIEIMYTAPKKVWFKVWTRAWWRKYWTSGTDFFYKTGAHDACEILDPKIEKDRDSIEMIREALRAARLMILANHKTSDVEFSYIGEANPRGKTGTPLCHLIKRRPKTGDDMLDTMWFYVSDEGVPHCIALRQLLRAQGIFFVHLDKFQVFNGVKFPTRIEIYAEVERNKFEKYIFADVVIDPEKGLRLKVNGGIDDEIFEFER